MRAFCCYVNNSSITNSLPSNQMTLARQYFIREELVREIGYCYGM